MSSPRPDRTTHDQRTPSTSNRPDPRDRAVMAVSWVLIVSIGTAILDPALLPDWLRALLGGLGLALSMSCACLFLWSLGRPAPEGRCPRCSNPIDAAGACCCRRCHRSMRSTRQAHRPRRTRALLKVAGVLPMFSVISMTSIEDLGPFERTAWPIIALGGALVIWWSFGDGRRDLCRCRRCAYDMDQTARIAARNAAGPQPPGDGSSTRDVDAPA